MIMTLRIGRTLVKSIKIVSPHRRIEVQCMPAVFFHANIQHFAQNGDSKRSRLVIYQFEKQNKKEKENFLQIIKIFKEKKTLDQGYVLFIKTAMKYMKDFGVHEDLETYKMLIDVLPKGKYIPRNPVQVLFNHYPIQQHLIVDLLSQMEDNGVVPDRELEIILLNVFGKHGLPLKKYWRMMYWIPKFININPWPVPYKKRRDPKALAQIAMNKTTHIDPMTKITEFRTKDLPDTIDDTWIISAMSPVQEELIAALPETETLYIEGPLQVWTGIHTVDYFVLRGNPIQREVIYLDLDDISNIEVPYHNIKKNLKVPLTKYEQNDGTYYGMCVTGTSSKDSLLSWIRFLQKTNPKLCRVPILFKLKSSAESKSLIDQQEKSLKTNTEAAEKSETAQ